MLVAIKLITDASHSDSSYFNEIAAFAALSHPNLLTCLGHSLTPGGVAIIVTEHFQSLAIDTLLAEDGPLLELDALALLKQLVSATLYFQQQGFAHRDIKSANVLFDVENFTVKLIDFGVSCALAEGLRQDRVGTPLNMMPEMLKGETYDPAQCDVWSLGLVFIEMLHGAHPLKDVTTIDQILVLQKSLLENIRANHLTSNEEPTVEEEVEQGSHPDPIHADRQDHGSERRPSEDGDADAPDSLPPKFEAPDDVPDSEFASKHDLPSDQSPRGLYSPFVHELLLLMLLPIDNVRDIHSVARHLLQPSSPVSSLI